MARVWNHTPGLTSNAGNFSFGFDFAATVAITAEGMWWWQTSTGTPPATVTAKLYTTGQVLLASGTNSSLSAGWNLVTFSSPFNCAAGTTYSAVMETTGEHGYDTGVLPRTSPDTLVVINPGRYESGWLYPDANTWDGLHGVDLEYEVTPAVRRRRRMTTYIRGTEGRLNDIMTTLGATTPSLWPFWEPTGTLVSGISVGDLVPSETAAAAEALEDDFAPVMLPSGLYSYHFHPTGDHHLAGIDSNNYSFGNGTVDTPFSVGAWIRPNVVTAGVIMAKYDSAGSKREWRLYIDSSGLLSMELRDESATATEIAAATTALAVGQWVFVVAAYDGTEDNPDLDLYVNGSAVNDGTTTETGSYVAMENTTAPLTIGCSGVSATPVNEFHGRIALPFITGKQLTAAEVATLYSYTAPMVGIS